MKNWSNYLKHTIEMIGIQRLALPFGIKPMAALTVLKPDIYATCPSDGKVLDYYAGTFEAVYVLLNPFIRPITISIDAFKPEFYPERSTIVATCKAVPWSEVEDLAGLPSLSAIDIGLRTQIGGLKEKYAVKEYADRLGNMTASLGVVPPCDGSHSDLLFNQVLGLFQELGHERVWVGDEFGLARELCWIDELKNGGKKPNFHHHNVFSADKSMLWTIHWDSHFSFLCSSLENLNRVKVSDRFEGFFCTPLTEVYWSVQDA